MQNRNLYLFIAAAALLVVAVLGYFSGDRFSGVPYWTYAAAGVGALLLGYALWASRGELRGGMRHRSTRTGIQVAAMVVIVAGILSVVELFSVKHYKRWDMTPGNFFSLSPKTVQLLDRLDREKQRVEFIAFVRTLERTQVEDILQQYANQSKQVTYRFVDLDANPRLAKRYDVDAYGTIVVVHPLADGAKDGAAAGKKEAQEPKAATPSTPAAAPPAAKPGEKEAQEEKKTFRSEKIYDLSENAIANAILKTIQTEQKKVYFLTGHGERPYSGTGREVLSTLATGMRDDNYRLDDLLLLRQGEKGVPEDANFVVIAAPKKDIEEAEAQALDGFLKRGGRLLVFLEPDTPRGRLIGLLERYGFEIPESIVLDPQAVRFALAGGNELTPFAADYGVHPVTNQLRGLATVFPTARKVAGKADPKRGIQAEELVKTGPGSFTVPRLGVQDNKLVFDPKEKKDGPIPIVTAVTVSLDAYAAGDKKEGAPEAKPAPGKDAKPKEAKIAVFGDADVASDAFIGAQGNGNLVLNAVNWLGGEQELISIAAKRRIGEPLFVGEGEGMFVRLLTVWTLPLFILLAGAAVYVRRRQLR
ncbi:MAG: GldG family protein [Candidatus Tectomicrobia bacterium]|uniref:GldG family protein n=1 Tax=Tectimicrobiota bacterium TaxID=2528274 RepID=A0A932I528_UNCTE|nr:GldG family protein [Candidatus Tectomicrobia bacterium]